MIFNEIYSVYYNVVAKIITRILEGGADEKELDRIVRDNAFGESVLTVMPSLKSEKWQLVRRDMSTSIKNKPTMPITLIQKEWLKAISLDPRMRLFGVEIDGLDGVEPLFTAADYILYDKYGDGDPYDDDGYVSRFRIVLSALKEKCPLRIKTFSRKGALITITVIPERLEYSEKDDKFRLITAGGGRHGRAVNLARMVSCEKCPVGEHTPSPSIRQESRTLTLRIRDERNALERCLLHFAHFEKRAEKIDETTYLVHIKYDKDDETEMVIRILSFGPLVEVTEPYEFRRLIIERLKKQKSCGL